MSNEPMVHNSTGRYFGTCIGIIAQNFSPFDTNCHFWYLSTQLWTYHLLPVLMRRSSILSANVDYRKTRLLYESFGNKCIAYVYLWVLHWLFGLAMVTNVDRGCFIMYFDRGCTHYPTRTGNNYSVEEAETCQDYKNRNFFSVFCKLTFVAPHIVLQHSFNNHFILFIVYNVE